MILSIISELYIEIIFVILAMLIVFFWWLKDYMEVNNMALWKEDYWEDCISFDHDTQLKEVDFYDEYMISNKINIDLRKYGNKKDQRGCTK